MKTLRLGHIPYANCFPVHAALLDGGPLADLELVLGTPAELNALLSAGEVDVAPASSIEYARNQDRYRVLRGLAIGSVGDAQSILLELTTRPQDLAGAVVAMPTASATSVVLTRVLLELRLEVSPQYRWFNQDSEDPFREGAAAALWIGDPAVSRQASPAAQGRSFLDLGRAWTEWSGLPFVYALWMTGLDVTRDPQLQELTERLRASRSFFHAHDRELALRHAGPLGQRPEWLLQYWRSLRYDLNDRALAGLRRFFDLAAELGEAPRVAEVRFV